MCGGFSRLRQRHDKVFGTPAFKDKKRQAGTYMVTACRFSMHSGIIRKIHLHDYLYITMRQTSLADFPKPYFLLLNFRFSVYLSFALSVAEAAFLCVVHGCDGFANVVRTQSKKMSSSLLTPSMTPLK